MSTYALIHGAGDVGWYWHLVGERLSRQGHDVLAPDLPCEDDTAGLAEYTDTVVDAIGDREDVIVVAQSFGGFVAPLVADRLPVREIVLVAGMLPAPGERPDDWFDNTGFAEVSHDGDVFYHDVPPELAAEARRRSRGQSETPGHAPWPLAAWPDVPTRFVLGTEDRFFPPDFLRRVVADRLGVVPIELRSGHCVALSRPRELTDVLTA